MIVHVFNSSKVGGPESLVLPALGALGLPHAAVFLLETRCGDGGRRGFDYARALGLAAHEISVGARVDRGAVAKLGALLARLGATIVHAHDVKASTYTLLAAKTARLDAALFSTHHGIHGRPDRKTRLYEAFYARAVLPWFDRVLAVSSADHRELVARGLGPVRAQLHQNGLDARYVAPADRAAVRARARRAWQLDETVPLVGVVARLSTEKRHDRALRALAALLRSRPDLRWRLACFGVGPREAALKTLAKTLGLADRVSWMGYRPRVGDELAGFDLLLSMSDAEGLPLNLIEAGWAGTPVVATRVGGVPDLVGAPSAGVLVETTDSPARIADAIAIVLEDPARGREHGLALQRRVLEQFTRRAWLSRLRELYAPFLARAEVAPAAGHA